MRNLFFAAGAAVFAIIASSPASGAILSLGGPLSHTCYDSARSQDAGDQAIEGCTRALQEESLTPHDFAATHVNRGILNMIRGHDSDADSDFDAALLTNQKLADAWLNKGFLRLRRGNGRDALPLLQKGIDAGPPRQALAIFARGVAYEQMGDYASAYADLRRAHDLEPRWPMPTEYLAEYRESQH
jgi:tetratricopeptide (TPR) repeat protein